MKLLLYTVCIVGLTVVAASQIHLPIYLVNLGTQFIFILFNNILCLFKFIERHVRISVVWPSSNEI